MDASVAGLPRGRGIRRVLIAGLLILLVVAAFGASYLARQKTIRQLNAAAALLKTSPPLVNSAKVKRAPSGSKSCFRATSHQSRKRTCTLARLGT